MGESLKEWLLSKNQRLSNYGYDWKDFRRMSNQKARYRRQLRNVPDREIRKTLATSGILGRGGRLQRTPSYIRLPSGKFARAGKKQWNYTTGQSYNEEYLNLLSLASSKGKKSYWERQR